jgi:hypothetical protein
LSEQEIYMAKLVRIPSRLARSYAVAPETAACALGVSLADFDSSVSIYLRPPQHERPRLVALTELQHWGVGT